MKVPETTGLRSSPNVSSDATRLGGAAGSSGVVIDAAGIAAPLTHNAAVPLAHNATVPLAASAAASLAPGTPPNVSHSPAARIRLDYLDGLRGIAALYVVLHHVWQFVITRPDLGPLPRWFRVFSVLKFGAYAVAVFIVLSGYCLMLPVARSEKLSLAGGVAAFIKRRARRILPPYYAVIAVTATLILTFPVLRARSNTQWDIALPGLDARAMLSHLFLVHNWSQTLQWKLDPPLWSVALEFQIYILFALLLLPIFRALGPAAALGVAMVVGAVPIVFGARFACSWYLGLFGMGMIASYINYGPKSIAWARKTEAICSRLSVLSWLLIPAAAIADAKLAYPYISETVVGLSIAIVLVATTARIEKGIPTRVGALFTTRPLLFLGAMSYSLYLVHFPMVALAYARIYESFSPLATFGLLIGVALPPILLFAYLFFLLFERPFLRRPAGAKA